MDVRIGCCAGVGDEVVAADVLGISEREVPAARVAGEPGCLAGSAGRLLRRSTGVDRAAARPPARRVREPR